MTAASQTKLCLLKFIFHILLVDTLLLSEGTVKTRCPFFVDAESNNNNEDNHHNNNNELHQSTTTTTTTLNNVDNLLLSQSDSKGHEQDLSNLIFQPSILDFKELSVGDADSEVVTVFNHHNRSVYLGAISGNVADFYSSFFEEKVIPPLGNTSFNVVFLPRHHGVVQTNLEIHTSFGTINYTLKGKGVECLFRLNPLIGLKAPINATLTPEIHMYNPYSTPLQIIEVYSSGGQFQLELPSGNPEGPQTLWQIPAFTTKPIIRVRFKATKPGNHTAYVRIKVSSHNNSELENVVLVVPVEVEILKEEGVYSEKPIMNFGIGGTGDAPKELSVILSHSDEYQQFDVLAYVVESDVKELKQAISLTLKTDSYKHIALHRIFATADWSKIPTDRRYFRGSIVIKALIKNKEYTHKIPFVGEILKGSINYNENLTKFVASPKNIRYPVDFVIKNDFKVPLAITNVTMYGDTSKHFKYSGFVPTVVPPGEEVVLFKLGLLLAATMPIRRTVYLRTNVSFYEIPLISYSGLLRRIVPVDELTINGKGEDELGFNYGTLPLSTVTDTVLAFVNDNPVPITIHNWTASISDAASLFVILRGCSNLTMDSLKFCYSIQPREWMLFQVSVLSNTVGTFFGRLAVKTDFEELITPVSFSTAMGRVEFSSILLDESKCIPGGICTVNISAYSTFSQKLVVNTIAVNLTSTNQITTNDYPKRLYPVVPSNKRTNIVQMQFKPKSICSSSGENECYVALPDRWPPSLLSENCKSMVKDLLYEKIEVFRNMKTSMSAISFRAETSQVRRYDFNGSVSLTWPRFIDKGLAGPLEFDECEAGDSVSMKVLVKNPTNDVIQAYFMLHNINQTGAAVTYPPEIVSWCWDCFLTESSVFSFVNTNISSQLIYYIRPKSTMPIEIRFHTNTAGVYSNLLYMRNNATVLEAVWIRAMAKPPPFRIGNRKPGVEDWPLTFDLTEKYLRYCDRATSPGTSTTTSTSSISNPQDNSVSVTIKKTFTARNHGDVPIDVFGMYIENLPCEGFGYRIFDCYNFRIQPNSAKKIEIAYTPDFTLTHVTKMLKFETSLNFPINFTLQSSVPAQALSACAKVLRRPEWEHKLYLISLSVLAISFLLVLLVSFFDSDKVLKDHVLNISKDKGPIQPTLDLRQIGLRSQQQHQSQQPQPQDDVKASSFSPTSLVQRKKSSTRKDYLDLDKKSWATVLVRKFSPIKSDVKFREPTPPPPPSKSNDHKKDKRLSKDSETVEATVVKSVSEDESSSTATENSTQSTNEMNVEKKSIAIKSVKLASSSLDPKPKAVVKKTKSLPLATVDKDKEATVAKQAKVTTKIANGTTTVKSTVKTAENGKPERTISPQSPGGAEFENNNLQQNQKAAQQRKYGKTPGRERKKNETNVRNPTKIQMGGKVGAYKGTAFQFTSPLTNSAPPPPPPVAPPIWEMNKISFSNVVAQSPYADASEPVGIMNSAIKNRDTLPKSLFKDLLDDELQTQRNIDDLDDLKSVNIDLGPIGTRKSPSNTPIWEPLPSIQKPIAMNGINGTAPPPVSSMSDSNSFFSGPFPQYSNFNDFGVNDPNNGPSDMDVLGGTSGLLNNIYSQNMNVKSREWGPTILLQLLQQQQYQELSLNNQPAAPTQFHNTVTMPEVNNHQLYSNSLWTSSNYSNAQQHHHQQHQQPQPREHTWSQGPIRPPPGLHPRNISMESNAQRLQNFDPFTSLSNIWSTENWQSPLNSSTNTTSSNATDTKSTTSQGPNNNQ